jgi:uncharacterized membrane protein YbhN (UPF0104 family)
VRNRVQDPLSDVDEEALGKASSRQIRLRARTATSLLISLTAIGGVVWWALRQKTPTFPTGARAISILVLCVGCYAVATIARGIRWHLILGLTNIEHRRLDALALTPVGYMGNTILPARAGEILRMLLLKTRSSSTRREIFGSIVAERVLDAVTLVAVFAVMTVIGVAGAPTGRGAALAAVGVLALGAAGVVILLALRRRGRFERFASVLRPFLISTKLLLCARGAVLALATAAIWLIEGLIYWLVAQSLSLPVNYIDSAYLVVLASIVAILPAAPGYLGTVDAAIIFGLRAIGIAGASALSFTILVRFIIFVPITVAGLVIMVARYGGLGRLRTRAIEESAD